MKKPNPPILLTPGPVPLSPSVLKSLSKPPPYHRSTQFAKILLSIQPYLKKIFQTKQTVLLLNASGTGAMAAALLNTLSAKDTVLVISAGKFGERWAEMAFAYKLRVHLIKIPWGEAVDIPAVRTALKKDSSIKAVLVQACETSTGVLHPVQALAQLTKKHPHVLFILDAVSALGAVDIPMDRWGIDVMIGGSQKSFGLPAGLSFISLSQKAWRFNKKASLSVYYFNLKKELTAQLKGQTAFSSNASYIQALHTHLLENKNPLKQNCQNARRRAKAAEHFCQKINLKIFAQTPSPSVTSMLLPPNINGVLLKEQINKKYGVIFAGGQGPLKGRILRIGHLNTGPRAALNLLKGLTALAWQLNTIHPQVFTKTKITQALAGLKKDLYKKNKM